MDTIVIQWYDSFNYWVAMGYPVLKWGWFFLFFTGPPWATQFKNGIGSWQPSLKMGLVFCGYSVLRSTTLSWR